MRARALLCGVRAQDTRAAAPPTACRENVNAPKRPFEARDEKAVDTSSPEAPGCQNLPPELRAPPRPARRDRRSRLTVGLSRRDHARHGPSPRSIPPETDHIRGVAWRDVVVVQDSRGISRGTDGRARRRAFRTASGDVRATCGHGDDGQAAAPHGLGLRPFLPRAQRRQLRDCLLYTSPSPRDATLSRMPSSA